MLSFGAVCISCSVALCAAHRLWQGLKPCCCRRHIRFAAICWEYAHQHCPTPTIHHSCAVSASHYSDRPPQGLEEQLQLAAQELRVWEVRLGWGGVGGTLEEQLQLAALELRMWKVGGVGGVAHA